MYCISIQLNSIVYVCSLHIVCVCAFVYAREYIHFCLWPLVSQLGLNGEQPKIIIIIIIIINIKDWAL